jgi:hypothetical protein
MDWREFRTFLAEVRDQAPTQKPFHRPSRLGIPPVDKLRFVRSSLLVHERIAAAESQERISFLAIIYCGGGHLVSIYSESAREAEMERA